MAIATNTPTTKKPMLFVAFVIAAAIQATAVQAKITAINDEELDLKNPTYIAGAYNVEDMVTISDHWAIGSGYELTKPGWLHLFNTDTNSVKQLLPELAKQQPPHLRNWGGIFPGCPSPPDYTNTIPHGLDYYPEKKMLYVVSHLDREAIEVYNVSFEGGVDDGNTEPTLTWTGCVLAPEKAYLDGVVALENGDLVVTQLYALDDAEGDVGRMAKGEEVGDFYYWSHSKGFTSLMYVDHKMSGPNGVLATRDGKTIWVNNWGGKAIDRWDRHPAVTLGDTISGGHYTLTARRKLPYFPDNVRWTPNGDGIYVGGQVSSFEEDSMCAATFKRCANIFFQVDLADPETLELTTLVPVGDYDGMRVGTGAVRTGDKLWLTSYDNDGIVLFPYKQKKESEDL